MTSSHFLLLVLALCVFCVSADVFVSLDCGSSEAYTDQENSIDWLGDEDYVSNGESYVVQSNNSISLVMDTLRVFTNRKKNCYLIDQVEKGGKVLIRASFYYGNYDGKSNPPSFSLQFDGNHWAKVTTMSDKLVYYETIYVVKGDYVSVCLAQTVRDQFPFISALEVRGLDSTMYSHVDSNYALFMRSRVAFGSNQIIRYTDDPYDRIWVPGNSLVSVISDATVIDTSHGDQPPQKVLQNAISPTNSSNIITWNMSFLPIASNVPIYMNMYFSEVTQLDSNQARSFMIFKDTESFSDPILPPYGNFTQLYVSNLTVSPDTTFSIVPTTNSTLPPLINALEIFIVGDALTDGTNSQDVENLVSLQKEFEVLQGWIGDPCLPSPYTYDWVNCSSNDPPRITALFLSGFNLSGSLPDFSSMDALEKIDLSDNNLDGPIPDFLGTLPNLKELNLANNQFSGPIPASLSDKNGLTIDTSGNSDLCSASNESCQNNDSSSTGNQSPTQSSNNKSPNKKKKKKNKLPIILGTTIPAFLLVWAIVGIFAILHYKNKVATTSASVNPGQTSGSNSPYGGAQGNNAKDVQMAENFEKVDGQHENSTNV
ncbi:putative leucine-rich repeat receptor-like protein kinase [Capsicum chacoense]